MIPLRPPVERPRNVDAVIDMHCHVLPGIDDGPATLEEALALAGEAWATGAHALVATPHVSWRYPNDAATIAQLAGELRDRLAQGHGGGRGVEIVEGAEIAATRALDLPGEELDRLCLGESRCLLVEPPPTAVASGIDLVVAKLQGRGYRVLLAHPERCAAFHRDPGLLASLVSGGCMTSVTAGSLAGRFGAAVRRYALDLEAAGMMHSVASDFHDRASRPPGIAAALEAAGLAGIAEWLTCEVPHAILEDREVPQRPSPTTRIGATAPHRASWMRRLGLKRA
jgi:protein-tyrosine phosphatase